MSLVAAIEINDTGLTVACGAGLLPPSPGYARFGAEGVTVGEAARRVARLVPREVDSQFWHALDTRPLPQPAAGGRSRADLAYEHLRTTWQSLRTDGAGAEVRAAACTVAGTARPEQLALLLGIARACAIPVNGFIDSAVATATAWSGRGRFVYVDIHLHQALATAVEVGEEARRERMEVVGRAGLAQLQEAWMRLIARVFITRTRFDPLHQARIEQTLFDALPGCLAALTHAPATEVEVAFGADTHRVTVTREEFLRETDPLYGQILLGVHRLRRAGHPLTVALSARAAALPGLAQRCAEFRDCEVVSCPAGCSALAAAAHAAHWPLAQESATLYRAGRPLTDAEAAGFRPEKIQHAEATAPQRAPTHVLYRGKAHALGPEPLVAGLAAGSGRLQIVGANAGISHLHCSLVRGNGEAEVIDHSRYGTWLNEERIAGRAPLRAGDHVRVGTPGATLELIAIDN